jgi:hypothetical protein
VSVGCGVVFHATDPGATLLPSPERRGSLRRARLPSLLRWFAYNVRRDDVTAAIALQRTRAKDTEGQVLDFLVRHCGHRRDLIEIKDQSPRTRATF